MKQTLLILIALMTVGCSQREYTNIYPSSKNTINIDKERCTYKAENTAPYITPLVRIDVNSNMTKKERRAKENLQRQNEQRTQRERDRKVRKLRDLCLKARGWRWKYVDK